MTSKLIANTVVFSGDVTLSRGSGQPVLTMSNSGMFLYGTGFASGSGVTPGVAGSPTYSASGLTSNPYVGIQSSGIGVFSGGSGPSVTINSGAVTVWSANGNFSNPYTQITSSGISIVQGTTGPAVVINASGMTLYSVNGNTSNPYVQITGSAVTIHNGSLTSPTINGGAITGSVYTLINGPVTITLDATNLIKINNSGNWYAQLTDQQLSLQGSAQGATVNSGGLSCTALGGVSAVYGVNGVSINGSQVLKSRYSSHPSTLADVIAVLSYHGLCA